MTQGLPSLDEEALRRLRRIVWRLHEKNGTAVPTPELVELATHASAGGLTVDLDASRELGHPMVVLRVPMTPGPDPVLERLSPREREVAALVAAHNGRLAR